MSVFTKPDWHASHHAVWSSVVKPLMPNREIRWLEIGSLEGRSAVWTLDNLLNPGDELVCVDVFADANLENAFDQNLNGRATKVKGRSVDYLRIEPGKFFGIYVDGSHDAPDVLADAVLAWQLLEAGGVMIFDDYLWQHPHYLPRRVSPGVAIDGFLASFCTRLAVLHKSRQVIVRKTR